MEPGNRNLRILLCEDEEPLVDVVRVAFQDEGIDLEVAVDGKEGVQKATANPPDLILMDVVMPHMDGYEAARLIKKHPKSKYVPIFFLTAKSMEEDVEAGKSVGAELYLVKPFSPFELLDLIRDFFHIQNQFVSGISLI